MLVHAEGPALEEWPLKPSSLAVLLTSEGEDTPVEQRPRVAIVKGRVEGVRAQNVLDDPIVIEALHLVERLVRHARVDHTGLGETIRSRWARDPG
jgi:hypothetical protein